MRQTLLLALLTALSPLTAAPPAMTPSTSTVTVSSAATIAFPTDRQILQTFTAATRTATAPIALGQCGLETDTGLLYVADGTTAGDWTFSAASWRSLILPSNAAGVLLNNGTGTLSWRGTTPANWIGETASAHAGKLAQYSSEGYLFAGGFFASDANIGSGSILLREDEVRISSAIGASVILTLPAFVEDIELTWPTAGGAMLSTGNLPALDAADLGSGAALTGKVLTANGSGGATWQPIAGEGLGDVSGPASSTDGAPALFDGTTGKLLKNSTPTGTGAPVLATSPTLVTPNLGQPSAVVLTYATGLPMSTGITGQVPIANGGTGTTTATAAFTALAPAQSGNSGKYLTTNGTTASWAALDGGGSLNGVATTDQSTTSTELVDVTGLSVSLEASSTYVFEINLVTISANSTEALGVALSGPSGNTCYSFTLLPTTNLGGLLYSYATATDVLAMHSAGVATAAPTRLYGSITTNSAGTFKLRFRAETGSHAVTIKAGSSLLVTKL